MIKKNQILTISNALSFFRLLLVIPVWYTLNNFQDETNRIITFILCIIAAITDIFDGRIARKRNEITEIGKVIDPLADKIFIAVLTIKFYLIEALSGYFLILIIFRDAILLIGGILLKIKLKRVLASNLLGKITAVIVGFLFLIIIIGLNKQNIFFIIFYYGSIFFYYASLIAYLMRAREFLKENRQDEIIK